MLEYKGALLTRYRIPEYTKLEYIKVSKGQHESHCRCTDALQEIGFTHMRILEGVGTIIQLSGLLARLCKMVSQR